jgi:hypothetical protein
MERRTVTLEKYVTDNPAVPAIKQPIVTQCTQGSDA